MFDANVNLFPFISHSIFKGFVVYFTSDHMSSQELFYISFPQKRCVVIITTTCLFKSNTDRIYLRLGVYSKAKYLVSTNEIIYEMNHILNCGYEIK